MAAAVAGAQYLIVQAWLRHPIDVPRFEATMALRAPSAHATDRSITLHTVKHIGRVLDENGRVHHVVPFDYRAGRPL